MADNVDDGSMRVHWYLISNVPCFCFSLTKISRIEVLIPFHHQNLICKFREKSSHARLGRMFDQVLWCYDYHHWSQASINIDIHTCDIFV